MQRAKLMYYIVLSGWVAGLVVCAAIVLSLVYTSATGGVVDPLIREWAGIIVAFFMGTFSGLIKDYLTGGEGWEE